jgi:hypothetical protein
MGWDIYLIYDTGAELFSVASEVPIKYEVET